MSRFEKMFLCFAISAILLFVGVRAFAQTSDPAQCPPKTPCKVVIMTQQEIETLTGPDMIFAQAQWARQQLGPLIEAWKNKITASPDGKVPPSSAAPTAPSGASGGAAPKSENKAGSK